MTQKQSRQRMRYQPRDSTPSISEHSLLSDTPTTIWRHETGIDLSHSMGWKSRISSISNAHNERHRSHWGTFDLLNTSTVLLEQCHGAEQCHVYSLKSKTTKTCLCAIMSQSLMKIFLSIFVFAHLVKTIDTSVPSSNRNEPHWHDASQSVQPRKRDTQHGRSSAHWICSHFCL